MENFEVINNIQENRFEVDIENLKAFLQYKKENTIIEFLHTEVPEEIGGQGIANSLAEYAFKYASEHELTVINYCAFIATYVKRHPQLKTMMQEP